MIINESKQLRYKTIEELIYWLDTLPKKWAFIDTETTGLGGARYQQLTQVSGIIIDKNNNKEISIFDEKIELTDDIKDRIEKDIEFPKGLKVGKTKYINPWHTKKVLKFNHYYSGDYMYKNEKDVIDSFFNWLDNFKPYTLVAQNASFDMSMLGGRYHHKIKYPVLDTKIIIQLFYIPLLQKLAETNDHYKDIINQIGKSDRDNGLISSSMSKIGPSLGLDMTNYHDSLTDCRITIKMLNEIMNFLKQNKNINIEKYQIDRINTYDK